MVLANQIPLDQEKVIGEMVRVARPGGIVGIARPHSPRSQLFQFLDDIASEIAVQREKKPPERFVHTRSDPGVIQAIFDQIGLEVIEMEEKGFVEDNLHRSLLATLIQPVFPFFVSYTAQIDENDTRAMVQGYLDFLEVREKIFDKKYDGRLEYYCLIAIGRKPNRT